MSRFTPSAASNNALRQLQAGHLQPADQLARQALTENRKDVQALAILGQIATMRGRFDDAVKHLSRCVQLAPKDVDLHVLLAEVYSTGARHREALSRYDRALRLKRQHPPALAGKANVLLRQGEVDKAHALLAPFVEAGSEDAGMAVVHARIARRMGRPEEAVEVVRRHLDDPVRKELTRTLAFELAASLDKAGAPDEAFETYAKANRVTKGAWDGAAESARYDETIEVFSAETLRRLPRASESSEVPVFIVGMPRSGSTLVEQIIDAHPEAYGAGELLFLPELIDGLGLKIGSTLPYPQCAADLEQGDVDDLAAAYLERVRPLAPRASRICDKYLGSYEHLGLISVLFPKAKIIHARRNPLDTCISCFFQKFAPGVPPYTEDLADLGRLYVDYDRIMRHWIEVLDIEVLEVDYETLVTDQETQIRRIIDFCALEFDERCLRFYETEREVITLSREQVNKPLYTSSIGRYRRYETHLGPLKEALTAGGWTDETLAEAARVSGG